jgi:hypothetical protein
MSTSPVNLHEAGEPPGRVFDYQEYWKGREKYSEVLNRVATLQGVPVDYLRSDQKTNYRRMLGEGLARCFDEHPDQAMEMLDKASEYVTARNQEVSRVWYLITTGITTAIVLVIGAVFWFWQEKVKGVIGAGAFRMLMGCLFGGIGAFFSILIRIGKTPLDPSAGIRLHIFEGVGRIRVGAFAALLLQLAIRLNLALPAVGQVSGMSAILFVSFIAGASERLAPTFIEHVELDSKAKKL